MKKDTYYFSHDYNAHNDIKILYMRQELGMEGYGIYWFLIESLADAGGILPLKIIPVLAKQMDSTETKVKAIITGYDLFDVKDSHFFSQRLLTHLELRSSLSNAGKIGANKRWKNGGAIGDANAKEKKGKESKGKETEIIINGKKFFNTEFNELPDIKLNSAIELLRITKNVKATKDQISGLWEVFKVQNLTGENYYHSEEKVYSHFINWVKTQNFKDADSKKPLNQQRFDAYVEYANRHS
jgi:hypothetical protein